MVSHTLLNAVHSPGSPILVCSRRCSNRMATNGTASGALGHGTLSEQDGQCFMMLLDMSHYLVDTITRVYKCVYPNQPCALHQFWPKVCKVPCSAPLMAGCW